MTSQLPIEVWGLVMRFLSTQDLKAVCLVSKTMHQVSSQQVWYEPKFPHESLEPSKLKFLLSSFPIKILRMSSLKFSRKGLFSEFNKFDEVLKEFIKIMGKADGLRLKADAVTNGRRYWLLPQHLRQISKRVNVVTVDLLDVLDNKLGKYKDEYLEILSNMPDLKEVRIGHYSNQFITMQTLRDLPVPPVPLYVSIVDFVITSTGDLEEFLQHLAQLKYLRGVSIHRREPYDQSDFCECEYISDEVDRFSTEQLNLFCKYKIPVDRICVQALEVTRGNCDEFISIVKVLRTFCTARVFNDENMPRKTAPTAPQALLLQKLVNEAAAEKRLRMQLAKEEHLASNESVKSNRNNKSIDVVAARTRSRSK